jgi:hypothetical protein
VVLPASMWAMMPMFRTLARFVVRSMATGSFQSLLLGSSTRDRREALPRYCGGELRPDHQR